MKITNEQAHIINAMMAEHIEGTNQTELMHFARQKEWTKEELLEGFKTIINIVTRGG